MLDYLLVVVVAAAGTYLLTFPARLLARRTGAVVLPDERRVHARPTPTAGGGAMLLAFLGTMVLASHLGHFHAVFANSSEPLGVVVAAAVIFLVGLVDDLREVSAPAKVAGQVLAATVLYYAGVTMYSFKVPFTHEVLVLSSSVTPLLTALWVVGIANAINLIDGLDGLAAGIVAIAAGALCVYGVRLGDLGLLSPASIGPLVAAIACGACIGFLPHNFHPARIFMGDAGAMLLGLLMAASTTVIGGRTADVSGHTYFFFAPLLIPVFILGVPVVDTAFAIVRRTARRSGVSTADKAHLHHRLLQMGHGHRRSVLILWAWTAVLSGFVLYPLFAPNGNAVIPFGLAALAIVLYTLFHPGVRHRRHEAVAAAAANGGHRHRRSAGRWGRSRPAHRAEPGRAEPGRAEPGQVSPESPGPGGGGDQVPVPGGVVEGSPGAGGAGSRQPGSGGGA
ncbi:MAG: glycosyltransferase family 4 protein [Acidimicrobiales bacterium]